MRGSGRGGRACCGCGVRAGGAAGYGIEGGSKLSCMQLPLPVATIHLLLLLHVQAFYFYYISITPGFLSYFNNPTECSWGVRQGSEFSRKTDEGSADLYFRCAHALDTHKQPERVCSKGNSLIHCHESLWLS